MDAEESGGFRDPEQPVVLDGACGKSLEHVHRPMIAHPATSRA